MQDIDEVYGVVILREARTMRVRRVHGSCAKLCRSSPACQASRIKLQYG